MHPRNQRREAVNQTLREQGYTLREDDGRLVGTQSGSQPIDHEADRPLGGAESVAVTEPHDADPLTVVSHIANAVHGGYVPVLIANEATSEPLHSVLSRPFLLRDEHNGGRVFHPVEDRIQLSDGSFACIETTGPIQWLEGPAATDEGRAATDDPQLHCRVGEKTTVVLDSVESLRCPSAAPFPLRYERGNDRRFRVLDGEQVVGTFGSVTAMKVAGYRPLPLPLVPEHHVRSNGGLARSVRLAVVDDDGVEFLAPD